MSGPPKGRGAPAGATPFFGAQSDEPRVDEPAGDEPARGEPAAGQPAGSGPAGGGPAGARADGELVGDDPGGDGLGGELPDGADAGLDEDEPPRDWAWVEEWRESPEPVPWGPGLAIAGFTLFLVASAVYVLSAGLLQRPVLAVAVNVLVVAGLCPALWLSRGLPVLRWVAGGAAAGVLVAWVSVFVFLT